MAQFTLSASADIDTTACQEADQVSGLRAAVDIPPCSPVKILADFTVGLAVAGGKFDGISSPRKAYAGQPVTIFGLGARFKATDSVLDGSKLYGLTATNGQFDDASTIKCLRPVSRYDLQIIFVGVV